MGQGFTVEWGGSLKTMDARIERYKANLLKAVFALATEWARRISTDAKTSAPWTDRTGAARRSLFGRAMRLATGVIIVIGHGVHYGIYLERRWGGKYAAIIPALQRAYAAVMASLAQLVR